MNNKYLPVGSVVMLEGGSKEVMVTGFFPIVEVDGQQRIYDYCGCLYPEGVVSSDQNLVFSNSQIKDILYLGYLSDKEVEFKKQLLEIAKENKLDESDNFQDSSLDIKDSNVESSNVNEKSNKNSDVLNNNLNDNISFDILDSSK